MSTIPDIQRTSHFVDAADGVRLHALDWGGDGPPVILIHGNGRTGRSWNAVARRLHDSYRVIALDVRGHGDSGPSALGNDSLARMKDIASVTEALDLPPHFVVSHSMGSMPAGLYAAQYPERVRGQLLIEPVVDVHDWWRVSEDISKSEWAATSRRATRRNGWVSLADLRSRLERNNMTKSFTPEVLDDILGEETRTFPDGRVEYKIDIAYNLDEVWDDREKLIDHASRFTMPTMILLRDGHNQLEGQMRPLANALPNSRLEIVPDLGHAMYMEDPALMADIARRFFADA